MKRKTERGKLSVLIHFLALGKEEKKGKSKLRKCIAHPMRFFILSILVDNLLKD
jgi:hypothetical protein